MNNHLPPPVQSLVSTIIAPQIIQPAALVSTNVNVLRSYDSSKLLPLEVSLDSLASLEVGNISDAEAEEPRFVASDLLAESGGNLADVNADKIVDAIIAINDDTNNTAESVAEQNDLNVSGNVETKAAKRVVKKKAAKNAKRKVASNYAIGISREVVDIEAGLCPVYKPIFAERTKFHRIAEVRVEQGMAISRVAKRLHISIDEAREQEKETSDLKLSQLYEWRDALECSVGELVLEPEEIPENPVKNRCQLIKLMKTVRAIIEESKDESVQILSRRMETWLIELMPELENVVAWPSVGQSREQQSVGICATRCLGFGSIYMRRKMPPPEDK